MEDTKKNETRFKHLKTLTEIEKRNFFQSFDIIFCDCDGVIWQALRDGIYGSSEATDYLRENGKHIIYVTNNSLISSDELLKKFENCNIKVEKRNIIHPAQTVCDYLQTIQFEGLIFCVASTAFKNLLRDAGFQIAEEKSAIISETVHELRAAIYSDDPVKAVVIDVDFNLTAAKLMRAHVHLKDPNCLFIGGAADKLIPFGGGDVIGPGPFISVVEQSTKRTATILGKPGIELRDILLKRYNINDPKRALFVGDSLTSDVKFGKMCGFQTLLVLSGGTRITDLDGNLDENEIPDYIAERLADFCDFK